MLTDGFGGLCCRAHYTGVMNFRSHTGIHVMACEILYKEIPHTFLKMLRETLFHVFAITDIGLGTMGSGGVI